MNDHAKAVLEAMRQRRSIRKFTDQPVEREHLEAMLEAGRWAPSGLNNQPWRFLVIRPEDPRAERLADCTKYAHVVRQAQALVCVLLEKEAMYSPMKDHQGAGACIQNMLLAAHAKGLGAVWLGQIINDQATALNAMGLDENTYELQAVLAVGHPAQKGSSERKTMNELLLEAL
ncbi:nitroreductase family protein [Pseudodesulfovibrio senegalensis]|jgi:nitroreductase|uniref:Nitroreductase family protein n=1 Tax=Pseudodesulfovibrio senegalensis TaxID=1721087 RepID=A0A6N6N4F1_9BACT|nr:nitroreductase family protein [Pseudodesulfovibrio senegalensis]KAB1443110.1 nitroreductase family protein [Pseudodesulfovibrio senegalensis]